MEKYYSWKIISWIVCVFISLLVLPWQCQNLIWLISKNTWNKKKRENTEKDSL
jgi:hypothetical protein